MEDRAAHGLHAVLEADEPLVGGLALAEVLTHVIQTSPQWPRPDVLPGLLAGMKTRCSCRRP